MRAAILCLGDPIVDLVVEHPGGDLADGLPLSPHPGGVIANVAAVAARAGAGTRLLGSVGGDGWGSWLRRRLEAAGVECDLLIESGERMTSVAFVTVSEAGEPSYTVHPGGLTPLGGVGVEAIEAEAGSAGGLVIGTNTLVGEAERELTMAARARALDTGVPVVFDANLRLSRWPSRAAAAASANACVPGARLVRANAAEAEIMTGERDPERAARSLLKAGAACVVISLGADGALMRGAISVDAEAPPVRVLSTSGSGDVLTGTLLATLALSNFYAPAAAAALPEAVARASAACTRWGALD